MKSFFSSRVSKFNALMALCALGITTFGVPAVAADRNRELQDEVTKRGISPEQVNRALKDKFPNSNFPYYEPVNGCSNRRADIGWNKVFEDACNNHDRCYTTVGELKLNCDDLLLIEMAKICNFLPSSRACPPPPKQCLAWSANRSRKYFRRKNFAAPNCPKTA